MSNQLGFEIIGRLLQKSAASRNKVRERKDARGDGGLDVTGVNLLLRQFREHEDTSRPFNDIKTNNLRALQDKLKKNESFVYQRDSCGGTIFHAAYMYEQYNICHWLVKNYPLEALHPFSERVILPKMSRMNTMDQMMNHPSSQAQMTSKKLRQDPVALNTFAQQPSMHEAPFPEPKHEDKGNKEIIYEPYPTIIERSAGMDNTDTSLLTKLCEYFGIAGSDSRKYEVDNGGNIVFPAENMPFKGENILHMTIIRRNFEEAAWLLDFYKEHEHTVFGGVNALLNAHASGTLFAIDGKTYFGGYPLHFAVCCNDMTMFDMVLSFESENLKNSIILKRVLRKKAEEDSLRQLIAHNLTHLRDHLKSQLSRSIPIVAAHDSHESLELDALAACNHAIYRCDKYGNNVLHLCVIHGLNEMYSHVRKTALRQIRREIIGALNKYEKLSREMKVKYGNILKLEEAFGRIEELFCFPPRQSEIIIPRKEMWTDSWISLQAATKLRERMLNVLNADFHSPLTLAADYTSFGEYTDDFEDIKTETLRIILEDELRFKYDFGPVHATTIEIEGLDRPYQKENYIINPIPANAKMHGAIEWLCISDSERGLQVSVVKDLIATKWRLIGIPVFNIRYNIHAVFTFFMTAIAFYPFKFPFAKDSLTPNTTRFVTVSYIVNFALIIYYVYQDGQYVKSLGRNFWDFFSGIRGAAILDRYLRTTMEFSFVGHVVCKWLLARKFHFVEPDNSELHFVALMRASMVFASLAVGVAWFYWFYFFLGFDSVAPFLLIVYRVFANDVYYFMKFYSIVAISFGVALSVISNDGTVGPYYGIYRAVLAMWALLQDTVGISTHIAVIDMDSSYDGLKWLMDFYITFFYVLVVLLMLNLLIGMIGTTYQMYSASKVGLVLMEQYNILCAMERTVSSKSRHAMLAKYATQSNSVGNVVGKGGKLIPPSYLFEYRRIEPGWMENKRKPGAKSSMSALLIMDPQVDFMATGNFPMKGSDDSYKLISKFIESNIESISGIFVTMQSHHEYHISHPCFWRSGNDRRQAVKHRQDANNRINRHHSQRRLGIEKISSMLATSTSVRRSIHVHGAESKVLDLELTNPDVLSARTSPSKPMGWTGESIDVHGPDDSPLQGHDLPCEEFDHAHADQEISDHPHDDTSPLDFSTKLWHHPATVRAQQESVSPTIRKYIRRLQHMEEIVKDQHPDPFTTIKAADVFTEDWLPVDKKHTDWCKEYLTKLEAAGKSHLTILPYHCIIESPGHTVSPDINRACRKWEYYRSKTTTYVMKGHSYRTETFSALQSEIEDPDDPSTALNENLLNMLRMYEKVLICGNTLSRSIRCTIADLAKNNISLSKLVILEDACTSIEGLEIETQKFLDDMKHKGLTVTTAQDASRFILN